MAAVTVLPGPATAAMDDGREAADRRGELERGDQRCRICAAARASSQPGAHLALAGAQGDAVRDFEW